jgi:hypothetical protein
MFKKDANSRTEFLEYILTSTLVSFPPPHPLFYLMPPKKKGISRKVRIAGPYLRPEAEPTHNAGDSAVPTPTSSTNHLLSLAQVAAARETAHAKYKAQLQSMYPIYSTYFSLSLIRNST